MNRTSTLFLQSVIVIFGVAGLAFLLLEPHVEGRNANATLYQIYFNDPFLAFAYLASIPFFVALYQGVKLVGNVGRNELYTQRSLKALRTMKKCGIALIFFVVMGIVWILLSDSDDKPPGFALGALAGLISLTIAACAGVFEKALKKAMGP